MIKISRADLYTITNIHRVVTAFEAFFKKINVGAENINTDVEDIGALFGQCVGYGSTSAYGSIVAASFIADGTMPTTQFLGLANHDGVIGHGPFSGIATDGATQSETWADGDVLYVSGTTAGALTNVAPATAIIVGFVVKAHASNGMIYINAK